jgi:hypothetical protein
MSNVKDAIREAADRAPESEISIEAVREDGLRRVRRRRILGAAGGGGSALALVAAIALILGPLARGGSNTEPRSANGMPAATRPPVVVAPGAYTYQHILITDSCPGTSDGTTTVGTVDGVAVCPDATLDLESWWTSDGSGEITVHSKPAGYGVATGTFGPGQFPTEGDVSTYPLDPTRLETFLLKRSGPDGASPRPEPSGIPLDDGLLWNAIQDYLGDTQYLNTTPALRSAMLDVLASLSSVTVDTQATDPAGRTAIALRLATDDDRIVVYVDRAGHDFLGMTQTWSSGQQETVIVESAGVTHATDETPTGPDRSIPTASP